MTLSTNQGPIGLTLDRAAAPCTVQSFLHLVGKRFYDRTPCHRLTAYPTLSVLQCGDPSGTSTDPFGAVGGPRSLTAPPVPTPAGRNYRKPDRYRRNQNPTRFGPTKRRGSPGRRLGGAVSDDQLGGELHPG
ncbi:peptidylprolyl isomerase [Micromonospora sp. DT4]|uniref:peptidylprolyl isomerase n=1 Tax=Micromonospora sp. DT4 TaxID=3393438 RepID=UPI003CF8B5C2